MISSIWNAAVIVSMRTVARMLPRRMLRMSWAMRKTSFQRRASVEIVSYVRAGNSSSARVPR